MPILLLLNSPKKNKALAPRKPISIRMKEGIMDCTQNTATMAAMQVMKGICTPKF
jgi:hypothetical protein